jgi:hypothetical protein
MGWAMPNPYKQMAKRVMMKRADVMRRCNLFANLHIFSDIPSFLSF